ncbi:hypothetical protein V2J09_007362 [Rumex salicifolius]
MADGVWSRPGVNYYSSSSSSAALHKRPRNEYESVPPGQGMHNNYLMQDNNQSAQRLMADTDSIGSAYDRYLQSSQVSSYASRDASNAGLGRSMVGGGISGIPLSESIARNLPRQAGSSLMQNGQGVGGHMPLDMGSRRGNDTMSLPPDASKTLYVEGLPRDATRREVARYREVRLVFKESKLRGDPMIMCFVDFADPACAATAMTALQGYEMDEHSPDPAVLRIQFSRYGPRSNPIRGRR